MMMKPVMFLVALYKQPGHDVFLLCTKLNCQGKSLGDGVIKSFIKGHIIH